MSKIFKIRDGVYATGTIGSKAQMVLQKVGRAKFAGVRGVRPTISDAHKLINPTKALSNAFSGR